MNDKNQPTTDISKASTLEEIADFWDNHMFDEYWEQSKEAVFETRIERKSQFARGATLPLTERELASLAAEGYQFYAEEASRFAEESAAVAESWQAAISADE